MPTPTGRQTATCSPLGKGSMPLKMSAPTGSGSLKARNILPERASHMVVSPSLLTVATTSPALSTATLVTQAACSSLRMALHVPFEGVVSQMMAMLSKPPVMMRHPSWKTFAGERVLIASPLCAYTIFTIDLTLPLQPSIPSPLIHSLPFPPKSPSETHTLA